MHPQNIFSEAVLLFVVGVILIVRDRGSATASNTYDSLLGWLLIALSFVRTSELFSSFADSRIHARSIVWFMWLIPIIIFSWLSYYFPRFDVIILEVLSVLFLIGVTLSLMTSDISYDVISPNCSAGASNGIYTWIRNDGGLFLGVSYYALLTFALIYLAGFSVSNIDYWTLVTLTTLSYILAALFIPEVRCNPLGTLGSLTTLIMLAIGIVSIFMVPG